ncbi:hypothetical protein ILYODFUR_031120 [Ilyodon furcidens]|uniref:DUF4371 domain-containing protein n=1 Tax=Ilyodon furcidens TaxID=33524 RepID=A0ABV0TN82_9TELE
MVKVLSDELCQQIFPGMQNNPYFSILSDKTADVAVRRQLITFGCYLNDKHEVVTSFLGIWDIPNSTAVTIVKAIKGFLGSIVDVDMTKMAGYGSDGASVMVGNTNGVSVT